MDFNTEIGKIYDTIFFLSYYFYENVNISYCFKDSENLDEDLKYLKILKSKNLDIPDCISMFFYKDNKYHNFMSDFMFDFLNFEKHNFDDLIKMICNKKFFKQYFVNKYFSDIKDYELHNLVNNVNIRNAYTLINSMDMPDSFKFQFKMTLDLFDDLVDELIKALRRVYLEVSLLHQDHHKEITVFFNELKNNDKKHKLSIYYAINPLKLESGIVSYSILSPYLIALKMKEKPFFLCGKACFYFLDKHLNYRHISWSSISKIMIDPAKVKIIELFYTQKEFSNPQLCKLLHYAKSTVAHHLDMLLSEKIIYHTKTVKRTFYYKINPAYFDALLDFVKNERLKAHGLKIAVNK